MNLFSAWMANRVFSYFDIVFPRFGLLDGTKKLQELYSRQTNVQDFTGLKTPVMMVVADLETGTKVVLKSGCIIDALRANISIPGDIAPAIVKNHWLADSGLVDPVPVSIARVMVAEVVIAANFDSPIVSRKKQEKESRPDQKKPFGCPKVPVVLSIGPAAAHRDCTIHEKSPCIRQPGDYTCPLRH